MVYGYARVSTLKQAKNGNSLEDQVKLLKEAGAEKIVTDSCTGAKMNRPAFSALMKEMKAGDKLIVTKLDRLARTAVDGGAIVQQLHDAGIIIHILNMGVCDFTPCGKLILQVLLAFGEFERSLIIERTQAGKAIARANGKQVDGRPKKYSAEKVEYALKMLEDGSSYSQVEKITGISKSTLIRAKRGASSEAV